MPLSPDQIQNLSVKRYSERELVSGGWQSEAECLGSDTEVFFPERGDRAVDAKDMCQRCKVARQCLEYTLLTVPNSRDDIGIWGGLSQRERAKIRKATKQIENND
jgi:WhiB family redox-sensing transcriptional regulator